MPYSLWLWFPSSCSVISQIFGKINLEENKYILLLKILLDLLHWVNELM